MTLSLFIFLITNSINTSILFFILRKEQSISAKTAIRVFSSSIISLIFWSTCNYLADTSSSSVNALFWTRLSFPAALAMGTSLVLFSYIFPIRNPVTPVLFFSYSMLIAGASYASMTTLVIENVTLVKAIGVSQINVGPLYLPVVGILLLLIIHSSYNFITSYRKLTGKHKAQIKYTLIGWSSFLSFAVITNAILPLLTGNANWSKFGPVGSIVMVSCITYAIIRHEFLDIKIIIQKGLIYSILLSSITGLYLILVFTFEIIFNRSDNTSILISALITTLVGIFGVQPLENFFQKITDTIFFKDRYNYAVVLNDLTDALNTTISLDTLVEKTTNILEKSLKIKKVTFLLKNTELVDKVHEGLLLPITSNRKTIGKLLLAEKHSGDPYTKEDLSLLTTFTKQAGTALEKASLYKQVEDYAVNLEKQVEKRTAEIVAIQKEQENLMLEISHGLQTPLTIMKGELFFLRKQGYETGKIDTIDASIDRISSFIYRFLNLSRIETSHTSKTTLDLGMIVRNAVTLFTQEAHEKGIVISFNNINKIPLEGNKEELEELISNLIGNAIKYMSHDREKRINITINQSEGGAEIILHDTGIGIKEENMSKLFKKFYRVKEQETKGITGTGLGLVICKKIMEKHNGTITVSSIFGKGTTFTLKFPL